MAKAPNSTGRGIDKKKGTFVFLGKQPGKLTREHPGLRDTEPPGDLSGGYPLLRGGN